MDPAHARLKRALSLKQTLSRSSGPAQSGKEPQLTEITHCTPTCHRQATHLPVCLALRGTLAHLPPFNKLRPKLQALASAAPGMQGPPG